jgi:hypothetical protein
MIAPYPVVTDSIAAVLLASFMSSGRIMVVVTASPLTGNASAYSEYSIAN